MQISIETVTPDSAKTWLEARANNRTPRKSQISKFASDMKGGRWQLNGSTLAFDDSGRLIDGQHRLLACIQSSAPFTTAIARNLAQGAARTIDTGKARTFGDALAFFGVDTLRNETASALRHVIAVRRDSTMASTHQITNAEMAEVYETEIDKARLSEAVHAAAPARSIYPTGPLGAIFYLSDQDADTKEAFARSVASGASLDGGSPVLALRNFIIRAKLQKVTIRQDARFNAGLVAWNAYCAGKTRKTLSGVTRPAKVA